MSAPDTCPNCGADVPPGALACPDCGADESTGWNERAKAQSLDLPDDEFSHDEFVKEEFGAKQNPAPAGWGSSRLWWAVAFVALVGFLITFLL